MDLENRAIKETTKIWNRIRSRKLPQAMQERGRNKLAELDAAAELLDLRFPPGNHLESLSGDRLGQHGIRINKQWRICFRWESGNAYEVEITDYH